MILGYGGLDGDEGDDGLGDSNDAPDGNEGALGREAALPLGARNVPMILSKVPSPEPDEVGYIDGASDADDTDLPDGVLSGLVEDMDLGLGAICDIADNEDTIPGLLGDDLTP